MHEKIKCGKISKKQQGTWVTMKQISELKAQMSQKLQEEMHRLSKKERKRGLIRTGIYCVWCCDVTFHWIVRR